MKRIFWCLGAGALLLSGCNSANRAASEPVAKSSQGVVAFDMNQFKVARTLELPYYNDSISGLAFSPDSKMVAGFGKGKDEERMGERGAVFLFDVASGSLLARLMADSLPNLPGYGPAFDGVVWSPDGKFVAAWNAAAPSPVNSFYVWEVATGKSTAVFRNETIGVTTAAWLPDGSLLIARSDSANPYSAQGQIVLCEGRSGKVKSVFDLGAQTVTSLSVQDQGNVQMLILKQIGIDKQTQEPLYQCMVRSWANGKLEPPTLQFKSGETFIRAAFGQSGLVALCGLKTSEADPKPALYAVGDSNTGKVLWQVQKGSNDITLQLSLAPDETKVWARTFDAHNDLVFETANGKSSTASEREFPFFSPDGKSFVRLLDSGKHSSGGQNLPDGQKPNLKIAEIWER